MIPLHHFVFLYRLTAVKNRQIQAVQQTHLLLLTADIILPIGNPAQSEIPLSVVYANHEHLLLPARIAFLFIQNILFYGNRFRIAQQNIRVRLNHLVLPDRSVLVVDRHRAADQHIPLFHRVPKRHLRHAAPRDDIRHDP